MMEIGAYVAQGCHYSKPVPEAVFEEMLSAGNGVRLLFDTGVILLILCENLSESGILCAEAV